ncbi:hypothetical protein OSB04_008870 [Centaurea solstitialis]|uniref:F-box/LRR-repeat protein 15/At3g58940/PEG3-like LRR domain-containing protein n=1 Tax=Centaurea solstitialis TaxID=347529 RepID=A0AA38TZD9_9ASTR|nr:hypothetical protein OSB04_008870 [Centaurea solstitialis]
MYQFYMLHMNNIILGVKSPVTRFSLHVPSEQSNNRVSTSEYRGIYAMIQSNINGWIRRLTGIGLRELTVVNMSKQCLKLHSTIFSCETITHLQFRNCRLGLPARFPFTKLLRLECEDISFGPRRRFGDFIRECPLLEDLKIGDNIMSDVTNDEIGRLKELKIFHVYLYGLYGETVSGPTLFTLLESLPKLKERHLDFKNCWVSSRDRMFATFSGLDSLSLRGIDFSISKEILCVYDSIGCSPNLRNLRIMVSYVDEVIALYLGFGNVDPFDSGEAKSVIMGRLRKLVSVELELFKGSKNELCFIKHILGRDISLEKMGVQKTRC